MFVKSIGIEWVFVYNDIKIEPLKTFEGKVIAIAKRNNDVENKLIVSNKYYSPEQIKALIEFQERYFETEIII